MPVDLTAAIAYVTEHGTVLEKARLLRLLLGVEPGREAYQKLLDSQNPDGGFPSRPRPGSQSAVDSTLTALWQFDELGLDDHPAAGRALRFLLAMQQPDGGWDENPALPAHDLPPWIVRGETSTRLYLTTYAAYWLGLFGYAQDDPFRRAAAFIAARQAPTGRIPGYLHNNWLGTSVFLLAGPSHPGYAQYAQKGLEFIASLPLSAAANPDPGATAGHAGFGATADADLSVGAATWEDSQIAWAIDCLTRAGIPPQHPWLAAALAELVRRQAADGSWASADGPAFAASATVSALKVLKQHGQIEDV
jgi:squalene cyclase